MTVESPNGNASIERDLALNPTSAMRSDEQLDVDIVDRVMKANISDLAGTPEFRQFTGGSSNLTYVVSYGERGFVLRRPPFGTKPKSGHSMIREYTVMSAIAPVYPAVPKLWFYRSAEDSEIDAEYYVMDLVPGFKMGLDLPERWPLDEAGTGEFCKRFFDKLIDLHAIDIDAVGLSDFGRPDGYVDRQVFGWNKRFAAVITDDVDRCEDIRQWLEDNRPATQSGASILHGDFRMDNTIIDPDDPFNIRVVLDWEISALGDPLMDLGNTLAYWLEATDPADVLSYRMQPTNAPGMLTRAQILEYYTQRTGVSTDNFDFYLVSGVWRLAAILQQIYYRYHTGESTNEKFAHFGKRVNALAGWARLLIDRA